MRNFRALLGRLQNMDARSRAGPWTGATLALIDARSRVAASHLAPRLGMETPHFKSNVRQLKGLGLTISYGTGYGLTSLGARHRRAHGILDGGTARVHAGCAARFVLRCC